MSQPINWQDATTETVHHLIRLIQAETVNPPGNELPAILVVKEILEQNGFGADDFTIVESAPGRANLVARLRGDGSARPLLLSGHVDVVPVEREYWAHDPFGGELIDGYVWGRGALDMKGFLAMYLQVFLQARRQGLHLKRDLILAAIADEEAGFIHGSRFLVTQHPELVNAEYGLTEGGAFTLHVGKTRLYAIQAAEKAVTWLKMTARGKPGHASMPHDENAVYTLAQAIERLHRAQHLPVHITPTFASMVDAASRQISSPARALIPLLRSPSAVSLLLRLAKGRSRTMLNALTTNTCTPTVLQAGSKTNVIPSEAFVHLDCRRLPGQTVEDVKREVLAITGDSVALELLVASDGAEFPTQDPLYQLLEKATHQLDLDGLVIPLLMPGATDASEYTKGGIKVYGFTPGVFPADFPAMDLAHGHDERLPVSFVESGLPVLWQVVEAWCTKE